MCVVKQQRDAVVYSLTVDNPHTRFTPPLCACHTLELKVCSTGDGDLDEVQSLRYEELIKGIWLCPCRTVKKKKKKGGRGDKLVRSLDLLQNMGPAR